MIITILKDVNQPPAFEDIPEQIIHAPKLAGDEVLDLRDHASDPDSPAFGIGEITFDEDATGIIFTSSFTIIFECKIWMLTNKGKWKLVLKVVFLVLLGDNT